MDEEQALSMSVCSGLAERVASLCLMPLPYTGECVHARAVSVPVDRMPGMLLPSRSDCVFQCAAQTCDLYVLLSRRRKSFINFILSHA
jgi:hypothetical protein